MTAPVSMMLNIDADLQVEVGGCKAVLTGTGGRLVLKADAPQLLLSSLRDVSLPNSAGGVRGLGKIADLLSAHGLELHVEGPSGEMALLGVGAGSGLGKLVTGSRAVQLGSLRALTGLVPTRRLVSLTVGVSAAAVGVIMLTLWRRRFRLS